MENLCNLLLHIRENPGPYIDRVEEYDQLIPSSMVKCVESDDGNYYYVLMCVGRRILRKCN
jgi:hypothetical protein